MPHFYRRCWLLLTAMLVLALVTSCGPPLSRAAAKGDTERARRLLQAGVDVDATDWQGWSALHEAAWYGHASMVELLLEHGADPALQFRSERCYTPLHCAAHCGRIEATRVLLTGGVPVDIESGEGTTALYAAAGRGHADVVRLLLDSGGDPSAGSGLPLHHAALAGGADVVAILLAAGVDVNTRNRWGQTALHRAAWSRSPETVRLLLTSGADANAVDSSGTTPLHEAAGRTSGQSPEAIRLLLTHGADVNARDKYDWTPLHDATFTSFADLEAAQLLLDAGATHTVHTAAAMGDVATLQRLLAREPGLLNAENAKYGWTPLHWAARRGEVATAELLLQSGAEVNARSKIGVTPLRLARRGARGEMARFLRRHGGAL